ncbi:MAG: prephenate dehydrogenase/arogenate dehydrogenase family protein [Acidimicrobiales bacterium]
MAIVGTGLIGGSLGLALRRRGWHVSGTDTMAGRAELAVELGALDATGLDVSAEIVFLATPAGSVVELARKALAICPGAVVTDVAGVKGPIAVQDLGGRFVGGHPMAGSEQEGIEAADAELFEGATWALTPIAGTAPQSYALVHSIVTTLGAEVIALSPAEHDSLVALVSHVPHLTAATLMNLAAAQAEEHRGLLRLAAGGFRDMTRIAAGSPEIWPAVCAENSEAISEHLGSVIDALERVRELVLKADTEALLELLEQARSARRNLPARSVPAAELLELRVPVPDRTGVLAEVTTLVTEVGADIFDIEIAHSAEGDRGVLVLVVAAKEADLVRGALLARGYRPSARRIGKA